MGVDVQYRDLPGGTHTLRFADELPRHLMCGMCGMLSMQMFEDERGHAFCNVCVCQKSQAAAIFCQYENRDVALDELVESHDIVQVIKDQVVFCPNEQKGCPAYSPLCELENHYLQCERTEIECGQCQQRIMGRHWKNHLVNCPRRIVQCRFCVTAFPQIDIQTHQALCVRRIPNVLRPRPCSNLTGAMHRHRPFLQREETDQNTFPLLIQNYTSHVLWLLKWTMPEESSGA
ncbi:hypothetical protein MTO96_012370 [Rhipicephalus appendiculatus]